MRYIKNTYFLEMLPYDQQKKVNPNFIRKFIYEKLKNDKNEEKTLFMRRKIKENFFHDFMLLITVVYLSKLSYSENLDGFLRHSYFRLFIILLYLLLIQEMKFWIGCFEIFGCLLF